MQSLLDSGKVLQVIAQFANEDIAKWPFWKRGDGYLMRGRAYAITKDAKQAESDLIFALEWPGDPRTRDSILLATAQNSENNFKNDEKAINNSFVDNPERECSNYFGKKPVKKLLKRNKLLSIFRGHQV